MIKLLMVLMDFSMGKSMEVSIELVLKNALTEALIKMLGPV